MLSADAAASAVNQFAWDVYQHMQHEDGNLLYSPLSISTALAMTSLGAASETLAQIQQVLHLGADPAIHQSFSDLSTSALLRSLLGPDFDFTIANAIWPQDGNPVEQSFINAVQSKYFGHVQNVDYSDPEAAEAIINAWVADKTQGKIDDLASGLSPATAMVLTNAVYFNALWADQFYEDGTQTRAFHLPNGGVVNAAMMYGQPAAARTQIDGFDVLELPFANFNYPDNPPFIVGPEYPTASMILVMPIDASASNVLSEQTLVAINQWVDSSPIRTSLEVRLPRFEIVVETHLNDFLAELGMPTAFDPGAADFSAMTSVAGAYIDQVLHKATIKVTEQGTEAAAATKVELLLCFAAGTPVRTPDGSCSIEQLGVGDIVLARDEHNLEAEVEPKVIEEVRRGSAAVLEVAVHGREIRATDLHPFFVRGNGWTPAGELRVGDKLYTSGVDWVEVERVTKTGRAIPVFNIRVADHHTYFVGGDDWGFAVWTHNFYGDGFYADRPFHFMIHDNATDAIVFMGRIDDPTQSGNSVSPSVATATAIPGDYNRDNRVDDLDYQAWRATFGMTGVGLAADGNGDGVVDAADYTVWRDHQQAVAAALSSIAEEAAPGRTELSQPSDAPALDALTPSFHEYAVPQHTAPRVSRPPVRATFDDPALLLLATAVVARSGEARTVLEAEAKGTLDAIDRGFQELSSAHQMHDGLDTPGRTNAIRCFTVSQ